MNRPIVIGILLFLISLGGLLFLVNRSRHQAPPAPASIPQQQAPAQAPTQSAPTERRINVLLFFNEKDSTRLTTEDRFVHYRETLRDQVYEVLSEMIRGSDHDLVSTLPDGTQLREVFIARDGTAYVDFSPELATKHVGGSLAEINTVYAIVNTLTLNFPQIKGVQILVDDHAVDTLTGHIDLSRPLHQDLSMVNTATPPGDQAQEPQTETAPSAPAQEKS